MWLVTFLDLLGHSGIEHILFFDSLVDFSKSWVGNRCNPLYGPSEGKKNLPTKTEDLGLSENGGYDVNRMGSL